MKCNQRKISKAVHFGPKNNHSYLIATGFSNLDSIYHIYRHLTNENKSRVMRGFIYDKHVFLNLDYS